MNFLQRIVSSLKSEVSAAPVGQKQGLEPQKPRSSSSRTLQLTMAGSGSHAGVERELAQLLGQIMSDNVIEHFELQDLSDWLKRNVEFGEEIPAITYLWRIVQSALSDEEVQPFEWAMIRAAIAKVLPPPQVKEITVIKVEPKVPSATVMPQSAPSSDGEDWVVIDTETSGLMNPIYAVEVAAQRMKGASPYGPSFRVFLNHDVPLEPAAVKTHGYTREFLRQNGISPKEAHRLLADYAEGLPMVSHNLAYDFNRVLSPEWSRLGLTEICPPAFCTVMLSRRCIPEASSVSLDSLARDFDLGSVSHKAADDVSLTVKLFSNVLAPRLVKAGIKDVRAVQQFARKTPVASCHEVLGGKRPESVTPPARKKRLSVKARRLKEFIQEIIRDGEISNHEFETLQKWIETEGVTCREAERVNDLLEGIMQDGKVTAEELKKLTEELSVIAA